MFYALCLGCGRSYEYNGPEDTFCPGCWNKLTIFCPRCHTYFRTRPAKSCPYCSAELVEAKPKTKTGT
ncbi:MAG: hypothetical protein HY652_15065 [Acidobacteria bacterium]|nr:hypothetical protein [Acidobacteriota bacterium]